MVQVYVYDSTGAKFELDLYKDEPIKITLSAEEITDLPRVNSAFSRSFRVPATQNNSKVFKWWYEVNTIDFDVTQRVKAELYSDGLFYKSGHIRINSAYVNGTADNIDLELVFFGETRDFASQIGEVTLNNLELQALNHYLTLSNVEDSWDGNLVNGDVVYAIANRGYDYDSSGSITIGAEIADQQQHGNSFQKSNHPLLTEQLTPMIRAKAIIDAIFAQTDYTYTADSFFNDPLFTELYTDGLPNASATITEEPPLFEAHGTGQTLSVFGGTDYIDFSNEISDDTNSYFPGSSFFLPPTAGDYTFENEINLRLGRSVGNTTPTYQVRLVQGSTVLLDTGVITAPAGVFAYRVKVPLNGTVTLAQFSGSNQVSIQVTINNTNGNNSVEAESNDATPTPTKFEVNAFNGTNIIAVPTLLKFDVKCIDFLKSILTKFKLIMVPSSTNDFEFVIKPWIDYIASGDRLDWTFKLDYNKDVQLKPIFFEQSQIIDYKDPTDEDFVNKDFTELNNRGYGELQFDSTSDLLKGVRKIESIFAPTPVETVEGFDDASEFVIPIFAKRGTEESDHGHLQELPMRPKPRLLYYNGLSDTLPNDEKYYISDGTTQVQKDVYPRFTQSSGFPSSATTVNLNWFRDTPLAPSLLNLGESVYEKYWNKYIQELYSPLARVVTAYFNLDSNDLRVLSFDDLIFIKNAYYRVLKVYDASLSETATVRVDLVKILETQTFANNGTPTGDGGGIDDVIVTGGGGTPVEPPGDDVWSGNDTNYGDNDNTWGNPTGSSFYHTVQACINPGDTFVAKHSSLIAIGDSVKMSGVIHVDICYEVIAHTVAPEDTTVLETFADCFSCNE